MVFIHNDATADLRKIRASDPEAFGRLYALLEQLRSTPSWVDRLLDHNFGSDRLGPLAVMRWIGAHKAPARLNLWRLKFWELERAELKYRVIYLYNWPDKSYNVMAVVQRDEFDYDDPNDPIRIRVFARCKADFPGA